MYLISLQRAYNDMSCSVKEEEVNVDEKDSSKYHPINTFPSLDGSNISFKSSFIK